MRWITLALPVLMAAGYTLSAREQPKSIRQIVFEMRIYRVEAIGNEGPPQQRSLAAPRVVTLEGRPARFQAGGELTVPAIEPGAVERIPFGVTVDFRPGTIQEGKTRLDLSFATTTVEKKTEEEVQLHTETTRFVGTATLGKPILMHTNDCDGRLMWMMVTPKEEKLEE